MDDGVGAKVAAPYRPARGLWTNEMRRWEICPYLEGTLNREVSALVECDVAGLVT